MKSGYKNKQPKQAFDLNLNKSVTYISQFHRIDNRYIVLKNGERLSVSKAKKEMLMARLGLKLSFLSNKILVDESNHLFDLFIPGHLKFLL